MIVVHNCNFIILGNVNIHLDVATDPSTKKFSSIVDSFSLLQMIETPTHRASHTIDIVLVRHNRSEGVSISIQLLVISDHSVITIQLPICRPPLISFNVTTQPWKNFDRKAFGRELLSSILCSSEDIWNEMSVDDLSRGILVCTDITCRSAYILHRRQETLSSDHSLVQCHLSSRETQVALF